MTIINKKQRGLLNQRAALFLALIMILETIAPSVSMALTSGPSAPEFSSFEPVATTNMVNEFSGDLTYNVPVLDIPGADGGGYALSLSYHSGENLESEASWVGYGWTLNPGAINRSKRGFADDTRSIHTFYNNVPKNWTASVGQSLGDVELFSTVIPISINGGLRYNNYKGFGYSAGMGLSIKGIVNIGYSVSDGTGSFSAQVNPLGLLSAIKGKKKSEDNKKELKGAKSWKEKKAIQFKQKMANRKSGMNAGGSLRSAAKSVLNGMTSAYGMHTFGDLQMPTSITPYKGESFNVAINLGLNAPPVPVGFSFGLSGNYTEQKNIPAIDRVGYGYLYSSDAFNTGQEGSMMDYYTEKDAPFNKRDRYMSIPFSNADQFAVTGEGVSGGFRLHSKNVGSFKPNKMESSMLILQAGVAVNVGMDLGVGLNVGVGREAITMYGNDWGTASVAAFNDYQFRQNLDESYFFRFSNDLGGNVQYGDDALASAFLNNKQPSFSSTGSNNHQSNTLSSSIDGVARSGRSSYIGYHTVNELSERSNTKSVYANDKSAATNNLRHFTPDYTSQIGEFTTTNEDGNSYVYGLPVYANNEKNMTYDMQGGNVPNNFIAYKDINGSNKMQIGTSSNEPYATAHLLTQITTPDYVDRSMDGPSLDDFGGYTQFVYKRTTTNYHWRMPYSGFNYSKGDNSNPEDDMGSYTSGDKEVCYLDKIITKTHIAVFKTSNRNDGVDAANDNTADVSTSAQGGNRLQRLDTICLYTNNQGSIGKLVKKICFKYDYSLCDGVPNYATSAPSVNGKGKLTLKALWVEYEGVVQAKISPYRFDYDYANPLTAYPFPYNYNDPSNGAYMNEYSAIIATPNSQNPLYSNTAIDAWGNYQKNGNARYLDMQHHVDQTPDADFDPAAWQLKRITLPSGGEIHIQYEQDDYLYVQNRRAMALVSLDPSSTNGTAGVFTLNVDADLGYTTAQKQALASLINAQLSGDKLYFKFLYSLIGNTAPSLTSCNSEFVTGYVNFGSATYNSGTGKIDVSVGNPSSPGYDLPVDVCKDLVKKEKGGKINPTGNCDPSDGISGGNSPKDIVVQLLNKWGTIFAGGLLCMQVDPAHSYFKIPLLNAKKGGGLRVKRLLMYDANGVDDGQPAVYGTEYIYQTENGESSGVASNEPATVREENALVTSLAKRSEQDFFQKAISGVDKDQFEGPLGESILPGASVGYSRIVSKNIFNGKTNTGFLVSEFYTDKDFPFDGYYDIAGDGVSNTPMNDQTLDKFWLNIPAIFANISINNIWATQGYRFVKTSMSGHPKSVSTYAGSYTPGALDISNKSSSTEYDYFKPGELVKVLNDDGSTSLQDIGKEVEVVMESRAVEDITEDISTSFDMTIGIIPPVIFTPYFTGSGSVSYAERKMYSHVTSKIVTYPVIQKSITTKAEGISHKTENTVFSRHTGKPVQTISTDGFDGKLLEQAPTAAQSGTYTNYQIPGYTQYKELGQKAINERKKMFSDANLTLNLSGSGTTYTMDMALTNPSNSGSLCNAMSAITVGDLVRVCVGNSGSNQSFFFHVDGMSGSSVNLLLTGNYNTSVTTTGAVYYFEIIKSGRTNQLNTNVGSYTTYGTSNQTVGSVGSLAARQTLVANLNAALNASILGGGQQNVAVPSAISILDSRGVCIAENFTITVNKISSTQFTLAVSGGYNCLNTFSFSVGSQFVLDNITSALKYQYGSLTCVLYDVPCLQFCYAAGASQGFSNVVASSASTMGHIWPYSNTFDMANVNAGKNDYETGAKGKWRVKSTYGYKEDIVGGAKENAGTHERIYKNAGTYTMQQFNWKANSLNDTNKWVRASTVTLYSPNGSPLEQKDAAHIYSMAKYGYNQTLPYLVSSNSEYGSCQFESFENVYGPFATKYYLEDGALLSSPTMISNLYAHSGVNSYSLAGVNSTYSLSTTTGTLSQQLFTQGASLKVWVKDASYAALPVKCTLRNASNTLVSTIPFVRVAQTGEWALYEVKITAWGSLVVSNGFNITIGNNQSTAVYLDDVRFQPLNSNANTYVYDKVTLKLLTSFDDQHFGLYYQYNQEGKLVRKLIETEKGMKTITETQYNVPKVARP